MMYEELIKALRCDFCITVYDDCKMWYCKEVEPNVWKECCLAKDAAAAIEALQAKVKDAFDEGYNFGYMAGIGCCSFKRAKQPPQEVQE